MERQLSLIKTNYRELEKRVFPRFPFGFMIFKEVAPCNMIFEVKDASLTGMQISLKDGTHNYVVGGSIEGDLHWKDISVKIMAKIQWVRESSLGLSFEGGISFEEKMRSFLSFDNIVSHIKPLHKADLTFDLPNNLKYWLKADGALDIYIWEYPSQGILRFQVLIMDYFIEWEEGLGLKSGVVRGHRGLDTPMAPEEEFIFEIDSAVVPEKTELALGVVRKLSEDFLPLAVKEFLIYKLGG